MFVLFEVSWVMPKTVIQMFKCWQGRFHHHRSAKTQKAVQLCVPCYNWQENKKTCDGVETMLSNCCWDLCMTGCLLGSIPSLSFLGFLYIYIFNLTLWFLPLYIWFMWTIFSLNKKKFYPGNHMSSIYNLNPSCPVPKEAAYCIPIPHFYLLQQPHPT